MNNILYLPTRYFPSISGAEFYFQRMAELLTKKNSYKIDIFTSNAIDFKALRDTSGKIITPDNKYFNEVNNLKVNRFIVNYNISNQEILKRLKVIPAYKALNLHDRGRISKGMLADIIAFPCDDYREILYHQGQLQPNFILKRGNIIN